LNLSVEMCGLIWIVVEGSGVVEDTGLSTFVVFYAVRDRYITQVNGIAFSTKVRQTKIRDSK
jgi:hypothetical protein